jgi:hypothetical protein
MFCTGGVLIIAAVRNLQRGFARRRWPQTQGRIVRAFVLVHTDSGEGDSYTPQVEYEYAIDAKTYRSSRRRFGQIGSWGRAQAERTIAPYQPGSSVPVYFNPSKPAEAVLATGTSWGNFLIAAAGIIFSGCGYALYEHARGRA